jgi:hypothetical protein
MALWQEVKENLVDWCTTAADKTQELSRIGVRAYDKFGIRRDIERQFTELGGLVYEALEAGRDGVLTDATVTAIVARINELQNDLKRKQEEIDHIKEEHRRRAAAQADCEPGFIPPAELPPASRDAARVAEEAGDLPDGEAGPEAPERSRADRTDGSSEAQNSD